MCTAIGCVSMQLSRLSPYTYAVRTNDDDYGHSTVHIQYLDHCVLLGRLAGGQIMLNISEISISSDIMLLYRFQLIHDVTLGLGCK
jgi:hypothetical protein